MKKKNCLNSKRLTRQEVQKLIENGGKFHAEFTDCFTQTYSTGYKNQPLVYELSGNRFLFIFDPKETSSGGKGDIYAGEYFLRWVRSHKRQQQDIPRGCVSSCSHWYYYSQHRENLIFQIDFLILDLAEKLAIDSQQLDFSYSSLDIITQKTEKYKAPADSGILDYDPQPDLINDLYDNLVAYVGEVLRRRVKGEWTISDLSMDQSSAHKYPYIRAELGGVLMPINIVWQELIGILPMNWRQETTDEIRRYALRNPMASTKLSLK